MKTTLLIATLTLAGTTAWSPATAAAADRSYYVTELAAQQKFDVYNDGRNTYLESIPGLVVTGATADGERYIVNGVPQQIRGFMNGKPITVMRGTPPLPKVTTPDPVVIDAKIKQLTATLDALSRQMPSARSSVQGTAAAHRAGAMPHVTGLREIQGPGQSHTATNVYTYRVSASDQNLRLLTERWSKVVGWTAIWDVDKDIPIGSAGEKAGDYKTAMRWVLASTEFGDLVVKPCFYSNAVVRIVRKTVKCNPNE